MENKTFIYISLLSQVDTILKVWLWLKELVIRRKAVEDSEGDVEPNFEQCVSL